MTNANSPTSTTPDNSVRGDKKKKSIIPKIFSSKKDIVGSSNGDVFEPYDVEYEIMARRKAFMEDSPMRKSFSEREASRSIEGLNLSNFQQSMVPATEIKEFRIFVATWNVGGKAPNNSLNLEDFLQVEGFADIYVCGFQEIVPLNAGNVLVSEDNEPAAKWLALINQALNKPQLDSFTDSSQHSNSSKDSKSNNIFNKSLLKVISKNLKADGSLLKMCNCPVDYFPYSNPKAGKFSEPSRYSAPLPRYQDKENDNLICSPDETQSPKSTVQMTYCLVASKQMVGIFLSVWAKKELVPYIGHLRACSVGRGIMGCLGNKGCISISMSVHRTSFCFVCSHLASGEKEGDELRRNSDVAEILKSTQFSKACKNPIRRAPERITDHDRIIWLGDLNYRIALSYEETRVLLEDNDWDTLLEKDQLNIEKEAGRVFSGFNEGGIMFAPTYKYSHNSDSYAGETVKSKKKRRTPAWCDRILWRGDGIEQLSYIRGESRFSDHRPVCAVFAVDVELMRRRHNKKNMYRKGYSCAVVRKLDFDECLHQRLSFSDL